MNHSETGVKRWILSGKTFLALTLLAASCATGYRDVVVKPGSDFDRKTPALIVADHGDPDGVKSILESKFREHGFHIVSGMDEVPKYTIRFRYTSLGLYGIREFTAAVFPVQGGDPVAYLNFQGRGMVDANVMAEELIVRLEAQLR